SSTPRPPRPPLVPYTTLFRSIAQVHLPPRVHRNRPLHQLAPMAKVVAETIVDRAKLYDADPRLESSAISQRPALEQLGSQEALRSEEHTSELQSRFDLVCRLL